MSIHSEGLSSFFDFFFFLCQESCYRCSRGVFSSYGFLLLSNLSRTEPEAQRKTRKQSREHKERVKFYVAFLFFDSFTSFISFDTNVFQLLVRFMPWRYVLYTLGWLSCLSLACVRLHFEATFSACASVTIYYGMVEVFWVSLCLGSRAYR